MLVGRRARDNETIERIGKLFGNSVDISGFPQISTGEGRVMLSPNCVNPVICVGPLAQADVKAGARPRAE